MDQTRYTMRQLTKELGVTARTLRHYEERKLIAPARRGQTRLYSFKDYARILIVLRGRRLGFTIAEMSEMLRMYDYKDGNTHDELLTARSRFQERIVNLRRKKNDIEEAIQQLTECVHQIDGALEGKPRTPWHDFFGERAGRKAQGALLQ